MTNEKLIRAIGDIDERFVEEADMVASAVPGVDAAPVKAAARAPRNRRRPLKIAAAACAAVLIFTIGFFGGSGGLGRNGSSYDRNYSANAPSTEDVYPSYSENDVKFGGSNKEGQASSVPSGINIADGDTSSGLKEQQTSTAGSKTQNTKLIYTATASLQTTEFEKTCAFIKSLAEQYFAYIESENVDNGSGSVTYYRSASYVIRVPAENYEAFLSGMSEDCRVVSLTQKMTDVSEQYFDMEQKLQTLRNKHDRLEELLQKADNMTDILSIEDALSENEYQINQYQGSLNKYDSLVSYSTVKVSLREVARPDAPIGDKPGFFQRLAESFTDGLANAGDALENLAYWISYNIVKLIVLAVIVVVIVKIHPIRKIKAARAKKNA